MEFDKEFVSTLKKKIKELMSDKETLDNKDSLTSLSQYMSIYSYICTVKAQQAQIEMVKYSQEMMKDVDFSKLDLNNLAGLLRK